MTCDDLIAFLAGILLATVLGSLFPVALWLASAGVGGE
jgi:hypothetical protein